MAIIISADEIKKELKGYTPDRAEMFHAESAKMADQEFEKEVKNSSYKEVIYAVIPDNLKRAFIAFLSRDRKFRDSHFYRTHSSSRKTLLWIALNYPKVKINIVESFYKSSKLKFANITPTGRKLLIEYLASLQMTKDDIIKKTI